jgi:hypothetical protein
MSADQNGLPLAHQVPVLQVTEATEVSEQRRLKDVIEMDRSIAGTMHSSNRRQ